MRFTTRSNPLENTGLATRLRTGTRQLHGVAEHTGVMGSLLQGTLSFGRYLHLLRNLFDIYQSLEVALVRYAHHPAIAPIFIPQLFRSAAIASDLDQLARPGWRTSCASEAATLHYVARLHELERGDPALLVAHAYVRYLGDLHGGQMLRRIVASLLPAAMVDATRFYDFGSAEDVRRYITNFRAGLQAIALGDAEIDRMVAEARLAFEMHCDIFDEIAKHKRR